jgi:hypothetical protein
MKKLFILFFSMSLILTCTDKRKILTKINEELTWKRFNNAKGILSNNKKYFTEIEFKYFDTYLNKLAEFYINFQECSKKYDARNVSTYWDTKTCMDSLNFSEIETLAKQYNEYFPPQLASYKKFKEEFDKNYIAYQIFLGEAKLEDYAYGVVKYNLETLYSGDELKKKVNEYVNLSLNEVFLNDKIPDKTDKNFLDLILPNLFLKITSIKEKELNKNTRDNYLYEELISTNFCNFNFEKENYTFYKDETMFILYFPREFKSYLIEINKLRKLKMDFIEIYFKEINQNQFVKRDYNDNKKTMTFLEEIKKKFSGFKYSTFLDVSGEKFSSTLDNSIQKLVQFFSLQKIEFLTTNICKYNELKNSFEDVQNKELDALNQGKILNEVKLQELSKSLNQINQLIINWERDFYKLTNKTFVYNVLCK